MEKKIILEQPMEIEKKSFIEEHLQGVTLPDAERSILKRVIHTTADFDYIQNLVFSETAVSTALEALQQGADIVTDTNMALSGINKRALQKLGGTAHCFMADEEVAAIAKQKGVTRAMVSMEKACSLHLCDWKRTDCIDSPVGTDCRTEDSTKADHWCSGWICQRH